MARANSTSPAVAQRCINGACAAEQPASSVLSACPDCGSLLDVVYDWEALGNNGRRPATREFFSRQTRAAESGVWAFGALLPFGASGRDVVSVGEGRTILQHAPPLGRAIGMRGKAPSDEPELHLQYEGLNPSGSFKDNGMTAGMTHARMAGAMVVACASTGNTSASMALYAARAGMRAVVFIGEGKIALGKLSQALDYGARTIQIAGDFDVCLARVREIAADPSTGVYLLNSVNPFRLEGQKTIMCRVLRDLGVAESPARMPDWIVVPGGNLGNCAAFAKALLEMRALGLVDRVPRLAVINARGARTLDRVVNELGVKWTPETGENSLAGSFDGAKVDAELARMSRAGEKAHTVASAIEINRPVNLPKALRALWAMNGVVRSVDDDAILDHKALVGRHGFGCEPASAASVAGAASLVKEGVIRPDERVVCILTGHQLKDPDATVGYHTGEKTPERPLANEPVRIADDAAAIRRAITE